MVFKFENLLAVLVFFYYITLYSMLGTAVYAVAIAVMFVVFIAKTRFVINAQVYSVLFFCTTVVFLFYFSIDHSRSMFATLYLVTLYLFAMLCSFYVKDLDALKKVLKIVIIAFGIIMIRNYFSNLGGGRAVGIAEQPNALGLLCGTGLMSCLVYTYLFWMRSSKPEKLLVVCVAVTSVYWLMLSGSRGAIIALALPASYICFTNFRYVYKYLIVLGALILGLGVVYSDVLARSILVQRLLMLPSAVGWDIDIGVPIDSSVVGGAADTIRLDLKSIAMNAFFDQPLVGNGLNTFIHKSNFVYTHSTILELLYSYGLIGTVSFFYFIVISYSLRSKIDSVRNREVLALRCCVLYFVAAGFSIPNFQSKTQFVLLFLIFVLYRFSNRLPERGSGNDTNKVACSNSQGW